MGSPEVPAPLPQGAGSGSAPPRPQRLVERDGREVALEVAIARGVGLVGVGAPAALRAFLVNTLETARPGQFVFVVPKIDLVDLLELRGEGSATPLPLLPAGLVVIESFDEAVDLLECEALARALAASDGQERVTHWEPTFVLVAMTSRYALNRLGWCWISDRAMASPLCSWVTGDRGARCRCGRVARCVRRVRGWAGSCMRCGWATWVRRERSSS